MPNGAEQELVALVANETNPAKNNSQQTLKQQQQSSPSAATTRSTCSYLERWMVLALLLLAFGAAMLFIDTEEEQEATVNGNVVAKGPSDFLDNDDFEAATRSPAMTVLATETPLVATPKPSVNVDDNSAPAANNTVTAASRENSPHKWLDNPDFAQQSNDHYKALGQNEVLPPFSIANKNIASLLQDFETSKQDLLQRLRSDYGAENMDAIFANGNHALMSATNRSRDNMKRKLTIKLLQVQLQQQQSQTKRATRNKAARNKPFKMIPFVWATGGHSAAAGHGNLYNESYTAVLERACQQPFAAVGLHVIGRNYAMGGTASGPEVAVCVDSIFGTDIDVLSWDFGMTDGDNYAAFALYFSHAGIHPNRPSAVALNLGSKGTQPRKDILREMEEQGMAAFYLDEAAETSAFQAIPESFGKSEQEIDEMPPYIRNFKCDGQIEKGDPFCGKAKFTGPVCDKRKFRTSWHPGWKWHALIGNIMALSLMDMLSEALKDLAAMPKYNPATLLKELKANEQKDYETFQASAISSYSVQMLPTTGGDGIDLDVIFRRRPFCRTARLPAESRYKGIMTDSDKKGVMTYDKGVGWQEAVSQVSSSEQMPLVYIENERQVCELPLNQDYQDFWFIRQQDAWQSITLPNDKEVAAYGSGEKLVGLVLVCHVSCSWGKCPTGDVREDGLEKGQLEYEVNGIPVTELTNIHACYLLKHKGGFYFPERNGRLTIKARLTEEKSYIRLLSIAVW